MPTLQRKVSVGEAGYYEINWTKNNGKPNNTKSFIAVAGMTPIPPRP